MLNMSRVVLVSGFGQFMKICVNNCREYVKTNKMNLERLYRIFVKLVYHYKPKQDNLYILGQFMIICLDNCRQYV